MIRLYNQTKPNPIRLYTSYNLIFFVLIFLSACTSKQDDSIRIKWADKHATGVIIPGNLLGNISSDSLKQLIQVRLVKAGNKTAILGEYSKDGNSIIFEPVVPFSRGLSYEILSRNKVIGRIEIPLADQLNAPSMIAIFPSQDTLPENLLKIYLKFSHPMQEGESQKYIALVKNKRDTVPDVFLNLQPELWDEKRTTLTIWLDPGRIKRDLQPNKRLGNPLKKGDEYEIIVSEKWKNTEGLSLKQQFSKRFFTTSRDSISPDPNQWILKIPVKGTTQPFEADFKEALDHFLAEDGISITDQKGNRIAGKVIITNKEHIYRFKPDSEWISGSYHLIIETRLEDLAGNNVNRPFDRDITRGKKPGANPLFKRSFQIK